MEIANAIEAALRCHTAKSVRFIGLYTGNWKRNRALYLRDALTNERIHLVEYPAAEEIAVVTEALHAIAGLRAMLQPVRPKRKPAAREVTRVTASPQRVSKRSQL